MKLPSNTTLAFLGAGNMAEAIIRGLLRTGAAEARQIIAADIRPERLDLLARDLGIRVLGDNAQATTQADVVVLAVKPQQMNSVLSQLANPAGRLFLSIAAGITTERLETALGGHARVVRAMPNTPALVGAGAAAICAGRFATATDLATARTILQAVGLCVQVDEAQMNAVTALSGSGPAYLFYFAEGLIEAGQAAGLARELAAQLATQTVIGAARLIEQAGESPEALRRKVTSPGGTTEAALRVLDARDWQGILRAALQAAAERGAELAR